MAQTWKIRGQIYTHGQLMELRKQGLDPHKDEIIMKFITNPQKKEEEVGLEPLPMTESEPTQRDKEEEEVKESLSTPLGGLSAQEEVEYKALVTERAWMKAATKARYYELKAKITNN